MNNFEKIEFLQKLYRIAETDLLINTQQGVTYSPTYFTILNSGEVKWDKQANAIISTNSKFLIVTLCVRLEAYYGIEMRVATLNILDSEFNIINEIALDKWEMLNLKFAANHYEDSRNIEEVTFRLIGNSESTFKITSKPTKMFTLKDVWKLLKELESHCETIREGELYCEYFKTKFELNNQYLTIETYERSLTNQKDLINQHQALLNKIAELVSNS